MTPDSAAAIRLPIVGVMGSGTVSHADLAVPLGRWLATQGVHLLTGGGRGVMEAASRAFCETPGRKGHTIGILPHSMSAELEDARPNARAAQVPGNDAREKPRGAESSATTHWAALPHGLPPSGRGPRPGYPNPWIEIPIFTHLPFTGLYGAELLSRNHINVLTGDVIVALPGSHGTASEVLLARTYLRPLIAFVHEPNEIPGLPAEVRWTSDFREVRRFVAEHLPGRREMRREASTEDFGERP